MKRREFITLLGGTAATWPLVARAQPAERMRRIGVLMAFNETDPRPNGWLSHFAKWLTDLGWTNGRRPACSARSQGSNLDASNRLLRWH